MESSDDSFVWTDASCVYEESDDGLYVRKEETMNEININSESEEKYKKNLQKYLIKSEYEIKNELLDSDNVKPEPDSDASPPSSKRNKKRERTPCSEAEAHDYLVALVKKEHRDTQIESSDEIPKKRKKKHVKEEYYETKDSSQESEVLDSSNYISKKEKTKRKKEKHDVDGDSEMVIEDKFSAEETVVETRPANILSTSENTGNDNIVKEGKTFKKEKKRKLTIQVLENDSSVLESGSSHDVNYEEGNVTQKDMNGHTAFETDSNKTKKQRTSKLSDCIQFEDGEDIIASCNETSSTNITTDTQSAKLRRFLKANPQLHPLPYTLAKDLVISQDDDIWLLNCPHEINILSLKDSNLTLDNKCKIKIDSHTFVGNVENEIDRAAILTFEHDKPVLKSLHINGIVNFRKRIPKSHIMEDHVITNNQTDFIPLPDTKRRHPLFGSDYKKAMKIPATVKSRLTNALIEPSPTIKEVKKKKKYKHRETDMDEEVPDGMNGRHKEARDEVCVRKRRRSLVPDQPAHKKTKRIKQELESADTWDSEKAIEENLFNF